MLEIFRRGLNSWLLAFQSFRTITIADDGEFLGIPFNNNPSPDETTRRTSLPINGNIQTFALESSSNTTAMDTVYTARINGADVAAVITVTAGINAVFSSIGNSIPFVIGDLLSCRVDFDDPVEVGTLNTSSSSLGGN